MRPLIFVVALISAMMFSTPAGAQTDCPNPHKSREWISSITRIGDSLGVKDYSVITGPRVRDYDANARELSSGRFWIEDATDELVFLVVVRPDIFDGPVVLVIEFSRGRGCSISESVIKLEHHLRILRQTPT